MNITPENIKQQTIKDWVMAYSDSLYTWALTKTSTVEIAEDLVQETFMVAFVSFEKFQHKSNPKTWLLAILNHKIIDFYRKKSNSPSSLNHLTEEQATAFTNSLFDQNERWSAIELTATLEHDRHLLDDPEFNAIMEFCLADLPEKWRMAIQYKFLLEKNSAEICQELELTTTNYWQVIHRAKLLLKKCIEKHWN